MDRSRQLLRTPGPAALRWANEQSNRLFEPWKTVPETQYANGSRQQYRYNADQYAGHQSVGTTKFEKVCMKWIVMKFYVYLCSMSACMFYVYVYVLCLRLCSMSMLMSSMSLGPASDVEWVDNWRYDGAVHGETHQSGSTRFWWWLRLWITTVSQQVSRADRRSFQSWMWLCDTEETVILLSYFCSNIDTSDDSCWHQCCRSGVKLKQHKVTIFNRLTGQPETEMQQIKYYHKHLVR